MATLYILTTIIKVYIYKLKVKGSDTENKTPRVKVKHQTLSKPQHTLPTFLIVGLYLEIFLPF